MRRLSRSELQTYDEDGFVIVPEVFPRAECAAINQEIDRLVVEQCRARGEEPSAATWLFSLGRQSPLTHRITHDERLLSLIEDIVQPGISIYSAKLVPKAPHSSEVCHWHQDDAYYARNQPSRCRMSVWLSLQDSDVANGAVHFVPGSHKWGLQPVAVKEDGHCLRAIDDPDPAVLATAVCPPVAAGSVVLFHGLTWHTSDPNRSDRLRRSFIVSYQEGSCLKGNGEQFEIVRQPA